VTHVSDIALSDGKKLHPLILSDQPDKLFNQMPTLNWAIQDCPSVKTWKIWKETIQALYCSNGRNLTTKLRKWTLTHKNWMVYYNVRGEFVSVYTMSWTKHIVTRHTWAFSEMSIIGIPTSQPCIRTSLDLHITDLQQVGQFYQFTIPIGIHYKSKRKSPTTYRQYLKTIAKWEKHLLKQWTYCTEKHGALIKCLKTRDNIYYVSDRGNDDGCGYFGWLIALDTTVLVEGSGNTLGSEHLMESL
jgi:hypothetical protein